MRIAAEREIAHVGESRGAANHDHDMIHELSKRLDALWRYDQYIANADGMGDLQQLWRDLKRQEEENVRRLKALIAEHVRKECF